MRSQDDASDGQGRRKMNTWRPIAMTSHRWRTVRCASPEVSDLPRTGGHRDLGRRGGIPQRTDRRRSGHLRGGVGAGRYVLDHPDVVARTGRCSIRRRARAGRDRGGEGGAATVRAVAGRPAAIGRHPSIVAAWPDPGRRVFTSTRFSPICERSGADIDADVDVPSRCDVASHRDPCATDRCG